MANVHRVYICGRLPYDIVARGNDNVRDWFAFMSSPSFGIKISYGLTSKKHVAETGGEYTYYNFKITGEEAVWGSDIKKFVEDLKKAGAEIDAANVKDIEMEGRDNPGDEYSILTD